jgi:Brp/Blh family beta-carotene 15,15'-monooxygenase
MEFLPVYQWAKRWSRIGVLVTIVILIGLRLSLSEINLSTQLAIALVGLLAGIPHGAIDHLISIPAHPRSRFTAYIVGYIALAVLAGWAIATWNVIGFQVVVAMSALHFGYGDAAYINESHDVADQRRNSFALESLYAIPAGFLPVILPLTDHRTLSALNRINPALDHWAGSHGSLIRTSTLVIGTIAAAIFLIIRKYSLAIDLGLLATLSLVAPPLIAFATYFGFWHAIRHTARLVPKLPKAIALASAGEWKPSIRAAVIPGLYAIGGTLVIAAILMLRSPGKFSSSLLWSTLVIIWALTVPHMATTARFDLRALRPRNHAQ